MAGCDMRQVAEGVYLVDARQFGRPGIGGVYLLSGTEAALVESGTSLAVPRVLAGLEEAGIPREAVRWIFVTHVHLDHAGGAGALVKELPRARVVVHPRGAKHLADPTKLVASVKQAVGDRFPLYGEAIPIPWERLHVAEDEERFAVGAHTLRAVFSPGHAPHHLCFFEEVKGLLFTGDAAGLYLGDGLIPATPPPSFDLELSLATLERLSALAPKALCYTHFGLRPGAEGLAEYGELLRWWVQVVGERRTEEAVLAALARQGWPVEDELVREDLLMSVRGVLMYLARREAEGA